MNYFYNTFVGPDTTDEKIIDEIQNLSDRLSTSTFVEDRRNSLIDMKKLDVGENCLSSLIQVLNEEEPDLIMLKTTMEILKLLFDSEKKEISDMFCKEFALDPENFSSLFRALEEKDLYVRLSCIHTIMELYKMVPYKLQESAIKCPMAISRISELLDDTKEMVRNESLLLMISLTEENSDIQKIFAFQSLFEKLIKIIEAQGGVDGDIIVQDCLQLMINLLKYNVPNQNYFTESGCLALIIKLFNVPEDENLKVEWRSPQKVTNTLTILELLRLLIVPDNINTKINQNVLNTSGTLNFLFSMSLHCDTPSIVKAHTLFTIGNMIKSNEGIQETFGKAIFIKKDEKTHTKIPEPFVTVITELVINNNEDFLVRLAACYAFECYLGSNHDAQIALATTLHQPSGIINFDPQEDEIITVGGLILSTLFIKIEDLVQDQLKIWFASILLGHIVQSNKQVKTMGLQINVIAFEDKVSRSILSSIVIQLSTVLKKSSRSDRTSRASISLLCLLTIWLHNSTNSVASFLRDRSNLQLLTEQAQNSAETNPYVQGLISFIFALLYEFNEESLSSFNTNELRTIIINAIGIDSFASSLIRLRESNYFRSSIPLYEMPDNAENDIFDSEKFLFDHWFVEFFKAHHRVAQTSLIEEKKGLSNILTNDEAANYKFQLEKKQEIIDQLHLQIKNLENDKKNLNNHITNLNLNLKQAASELAHFKNQPQSAVPSLDPSSQTQRPQTPPVKKNEKMKIFSL